MAGVDDGAGSVGAAPGAVASADEAVDDDAVDFVEPDGADRFLVNTPTGNSRK